MPEDNICKNCNKEMELLRQEEIAGTTYNFLKCDKCKRQIARPEG